MPEGRQAITPQLEVTRTEAATMEPRVRTAGFGCVVAVMICTLGGCADLSPTQRRAATGTVVGAAGGAAIGAMAGNAAMGTAIGAGAGLLGGLIYDQHEKSKERAYQEGVQQGQQQR